MVGCGFWDGKQVVHIKKGSHFGFPLLVNEVILWVYIKKTAI